MDLLNRGLNFTPKPVHLPFFDSIVDIETCIKYKPLQTKEIIRHVARPIIVNAKSNFKCDRDTRDTHNIIKELQQKDVFYIKADKGNKVVIMNKSDYDEKVLQSITDNKYKTLTKTPLPGMIRSSKEIIKNIHTTFSIPNWKLNVSNPEVPKLYSLPKVHKPGGKMRNIVSNINSPSVKVAKWLVNELKNFPIESMAVRNSFDFVDKIKDITFEEDEVMISFDVESLFPSIPIPDALNALYTHLDKFDIPDDKMQVFLKSAKLCMSHNFFKFRDKYYQVEQGTSMGNPLSPLIAEVFMATFEMDLKQKGLLPRIWYRYVDDIFAVVKSNEINKTLDIINSQFESINFTMEKEDDNKLPFLELLVTKTSNKVEFSIYRKPTTTNRYITNDSHCPMQHKLAAFHSLVHRLCKLPLSVSNFHHEYKFLKKLAIINGYHDRIIDKLIKKHMDKIQKSRLSTLFSQHKLLNQNNTVRASMTYAPSITNKLKAKLKRKDVELVFSSNNKMKNLLGSTKDKLNLREMSGIYQYECDGCEEKYIGQTKRNIGVRYSEHLAHIRYNRPEKSSIASHALEKDHCNVSFDRMKLLKQVTNSRQLDAYESAYIHKANNLMNNDEGNIISPLFDLL